MIPDGQLSSSDPSPDFPHSPKASPSVFRIITLSKCSSVIKSLPSGDMDIAEGQVNSQ